MKYKGVIFDLDGTLLDTIADISDAVNQTLIDYGYPIFNYEEYKLKLGSGFRYLIEQSVPKGSSEETIKKVLSGFAHYYTTNYLNKTIPYEGIDELLDELVSMGIKLGINSNKRNDFVNNLVEKYFSRIPFKGVFGERKEVPKKPDPYAAHEIAGLMGLKSEEILYIGDSNTDIMTAKNANMDSIGVLWGFRAYDELKETGAKFIVSNPKEIIKIITID